MSAISLLASTEQCAYGPRTLERSTTPRGLDAEVTSALAKRNRKPSLSTNQRRRQFLMCSPCDCNQPAFSGSSQNSASSAVGSCAHQLGSVTLGCGQLA